MTERKARARGSEQPVKEGDVGVGQEITGLLITASGVWFVLSLAGRGGGWLGGILSQGLATIGGRAGAWVASLFFIWLGLHLVYLRFHQRRFTWGRRASGLAIMLLMLQVIFQLWTYGGHPEGGDWENAMQGLGGGVIGWALAVPLTRAFGLAGRYVVLITLMLIGLVLNTDLTLGKVVHWFKERMFAGARGARDAAGDWYDLVKTRPGKAEAAARGGKPARVAGQEPEPALVRRNAATEELNTIGDRKKKGPMSDLPVIRMTDEPERAGKGADPTEPERHEPVIRRTDALAAITGPIGGAGSALAGGAGAAGAGSALPGGAGAAGAGAGGAAGATADRVSDLSGRASRSVQAAADKRKSGEEEPVPKLVPNHQGQLQLDPAKLGESYRLPTIQMLPKPVPRPSASRQDHLERADLLERTLKTFGVEARVVEISPGPAVTRYELQPGEGVRVNKFTQLADDLALALAAEDIRIEAPIPGKAAVGIEVPNKEREAVPLREVMETPAFQNNPSKLSVAFGKDNAGNPVVGDLSKMPHLLIAGSTGSGKSVCMNTIICSVLFKARPDEVKMLMIDPKMVELSTYNGVPHLTAPVITDVKKAAGYLKGAVREMENRYELFAASGVRNIQQYNQLCLTDPGPDPEHPRKPLPYVVIFIDELADLMMVAPVDVEDAICRLAQMARACGMHLVIATQSPRVDVITGLIKANIPSRVAFAVSSQVDSRVIMDYAGAERLLGRGDMLYHPTGLSKAMRAQGAFIGEKEVEELVKYVKAQGKPVYTAEEVAVEVGAGKSKSAGAASGEAEPSSAADAVFPQAVRVVIEHGQASVSILQRRLRCNYNKAARLIDMMEERGFIGPHQGSKPRDVLVTLPQWQEMFGDTEAAASMDLPEEE